MVKVVFEREVGNLDGEPVEMEFEWVQLTYNVLRTDSDTELAVYLDHHLIVDEFREVDQSWSVVIDGKVRRFSDIIIG